MPYQHIINMYRSYTIRIHPIYLNFFKAFCCHSISFPCYYYTAILYDWPYNLRLQYYERLPIFSTPVRLYERRIQCRNGNILFLKVPGMPASPLQTPYQQENTAFAKGIIPMMGLRSKSFPASGGKGFRSFQS